MTEDFTDRLRLQLRRAALGEERRGALSRRPVAVRPRPSFAVAAFASAAAAALLLVVTLWLLGSRENEPAVPAGPRVVANVRLADALGGEADAGFGSLWLSESQEGQILRVDPSTRRVTARIPVGDEAAIATGDGSVWAVPRGAVKHGDPVLRIDPRTGRTVARIAQRTPAGEPFDGGFIIIGPRVWVLGSSGAIAIDPATNRVVREIHLGGGYLVVDALLRGRQLWLITSDRRITRFDARTGRRLGRVSWRTTGFLLPFADKLVAVSKGSVALLDPATGKAAWRTRLGTELHDARVNGSRVFVEGADGATARERVWQLDARTGRVAGVVTMPEFGPAGMVPVVSGVWLLTSGGHAVDVQP
jgi:hypothetical protein